jgi:hypothetical protein
LKQKKYKCIKNVVKNKNQKRKQKWKRNKKDKIARNDRPGRPIPCLSRCAARGSGRPDQPERLSSVQPTERLFCLSVVSMGRPISSQWGSFPWIQFPVSLLPFSSLVVFLSSYFTCTYSILFFIFLFW